MREQHQTKEDQKLTATETSLGINVGYKTDSWQHKALVSLDLMQYETVKFYLFRLGTGGGGLFTNKRRQLDGAYCRQGRRCGQMGGNQAAQGRFRYGIFDFS